MLNNAFVSYSDMVTYQITPDFGVDNTSNEVIASSLINIYEKPLKRLSMSEGRFNKPHQVYFDILLNKNGASFYLSIPKNYNDLILGKVDATWKKCAIEQVQDNELFKFRKSTTVGGEMVLKYYNYHSISTNMRDSNHLNSLFSNIRNLKDDDKVLINIAIEPMLRKNWLSIVDDEIKKEKDDKPRMSESDLFDIVSKKGLEVALVGVDLYMEYRLLLIDSLLGLVGMNGKTLTDSLGLSAMLHKTDKHGERSASRGGDSATKKISEVAKVNINILSSSQNQSKARMNLISVGESYKELNADNELVLKEFVDTKVGSVLLSKIQQIATRNIKVSENCIFSTKEIAKLLQLPQRSIQREHKLKVIDSLEVDVPKSLLSGDVPIGVVKYRGKEHIVYRDTDKSTRCLPWIAVGAQDAGKTTLMKRIAYENYKSKDSNFIVDHIEDCKIAKAVRDIVPQGDRYDIKVSLSNQTNVPSFSFNEISNHITEGMDSFERISLASNIADQVELIVNNITDESTGSLTDPMVRFLYSACMVTFIRPQATLQDAFDVLRKPKYRTRAIEYAKNSGCFDSDDDIFLNLKQLDKKAKDENGDEYVVNNDSLIVGIANRITSLEKVPYVRKMLSQKPNKDEDFLKFIEQGKTIVISIPQYDFHSKKIRDMIVSYYTSRLWLAVQSRKDNENATPCHIFLDEVYTIKGTMTLMQQSLTEFRRHRLGLFTSCHYLGQFEKVWETIKSCGTSYILLSSTEKQQAELLKDEMKPFELDDLLELKSHHAIVIQKYKGGFTQYISRIPNFGEKLK